MALNSHEARSNIRRALQDHPEAELATLLRPLPPSVEPLPPPLPMPRSWSREAYHARRDFLASHGGPSLEAIRLDDHDPEADALQGNIENFIGMARIPVGVVGPLRVRGVHARGDFFLPLATSEGALVASYNRGAHAISVSGGATSLLLSESVQRTPTFVFEDLVEASRFVLWAMENIEALRQAASTRSRHGRLGEIRPQMDGSQVTLILEYTTGDASGQNMVTFCTDAVCRHIRERCPIVPKRWYLEGNLSGDKKATAVSFSHVRGKKVTTEAHLSGEVLRTILGTTARDMVEYWKTCAVNGVHSGSIGINGHFANGLAALFAATGQDIACVAEAAVGTTRCDETADGGLHACVTLPNLMLGTVGGGTGLPTAREALAIAGCVGDGSARKLAELCGALLLAGELSIIAALASGDFSRAHLAYGRPRASGARKSVSKEEP